MKKIKKISATLMVLSMLMAGVMAIYPAGNAKAVTHGLSGASHLGELIVLDGLFPNVFDDGRISGASRLGELIVLDGLFGFNATAGGGAGTVSRLGELIVLDGLFGFNTTAGAGNVSRLGELLVLDGLFGFGL